MRHPHLILFGNRIRELRKGQGQSQEALAERADVHRILIGFIERGERNVGTLTVVKLAFALDV